MSQDSFVIIRSGSTDDSVLEEAPEFIEAEDEFTDVEDEKLDELTAANSSPPLDHFLLVTEHFEPPQNEQMRKDKYLEWSNRLEHALRFYAEDQLFQAKLVLDKLVHEVSMLKEHGKQESVPSLVKVAERFSTVLFNNPFVKAVYEETEAAHALLNRLKDQSGWATVTRKENILTQYRKEKSSLLHSIRVATDISSSVFKVLALINEVDLISQLSNDMHARTVHETGRFSKIVHLHIRTPWPFDDRDAVFHARGIDMLSEGKIIIVGKSITEEKFQGVDIPPVLPGCKRMDFNLLGSLIKPLKPEQTRLECIYNLDLHMDTIPKPLLNFFTRHLAFYGAQLFCKQATQISNTEFDKCLQRRPQVYGELQKRIKTYFHSAEK